MTKAEIKLVEPMFLEKSYYDCKDKHLMFLTSCFTISCMTVNIDLLKLSFESRLNDLLEHLHRC